MSVSLTPSRRGYHRIAAATCLALALAGTLLLALATGGLTRPLANAAAGVYGALTLGAALWLLMRLPGSGRICLVTFVSAQAFWFGWPALSGSLRGPWFGVAANYRLNPRDVVLTTLYLAVFGILSAMAYWLAAMRLARRAAPERPRPAARPRGPERRRRMVLGLALLVLGLLPFLVYGTTLSSTLSDILASRGASKPWAQAAFESKPLYVIGRASLVAAGILALHQALNSRRQRAIWSGIFLLAFALTYFDSGTRTWTVMMLVSPGLVALRRGVLAARVKRWVVVGAALLALVLLLSELQLQFRSTGFASNAQTGAAGPLLRDSNYFTETAIAVNLVPAHIDYVHESAILLHLVNPIPRAWWPDKPYSRVVELYSLGRTGFDEYLTIGTSRLPSIVGQYHMSWGAWGVMAIALGLGAFLAWLDLLWVRHGRETLGQIFAATACMWVFLGFRGLFAGIHYPALLLGVAWILERALQRGRSRQTASIRSQKRRAPAAEW